MSTELKREGWKPTVYDRPDDWRQFEAGGLCDHMVVSGPRADGTWNCFVTRSVTETCHATPEAAAIAAERMRDAMRAAPEAVRLLAKLLPHVGDTAPMEDIEKAYDLVRVALGGAR